MSITYNRNATVFCTIRKENQLDFYVNMGNEEVYLFSTDYFTHPIYDAYKNGQRVEDIIQKTKHHRQQYLKDRIIRSLRYIEQEYEVAFFNKSHDKAAGKSNKRSRKGMKERYAR